MKYLILISLFIPLLSFAQLEDCDYPVATPILGEEQEKMVMGVNQAIKRNFKRRPMGSNFKLALSIETNFNVPIIGKDVYWGRIYLKNGNNNEIAYRDDLVAEKRFYQEQSKPDTMFYSDYPVKDINSAAGLSLVKAAGAEVNVRAIGKFSPKTGGRLYIKVKPPGEKSLFLTVDVVNANGKISNFLILNNKRIPFDSFKINASKNFLGITSILNGIDNIQFTSRGKIVHTITQ